MAMTDPSLPAGVRSTDFDWLEALGLTNALQQGLPTSGISRRQVGPMDRTAVLRGFLPTSSIDLGGLGGAVSGAVGGAKNLQFRQQVDLGPLAGLVDPLAAFALSSLGPQGGGSVDIGQALAAFGGAAGDASGALAPQDVSALTAEHLGLLREQAAPFEQRAFNSLQDNLFATGRMGTTGGGIQTEAFARGLGQADLARQLAAFDVGQQAQASAANRALARFGVAQSLFDSQMGARAGSIQQLLAALQGFGGIQGYGLNNLNATLAGSQAFSNSALGRAQTKGPSNFQNVMGGLSAFGEAAGGAAAAFGASDQRLKTDVEPIAGATLAGAQLYRWRWNDEAKALGLEGPAYGVMADEVLEAHPDAVGVIDGYLAVDYGALLAKEAA